MTVVLHSETVGGFNCFHPPLMLLKQILSWLVNLRHCSSTESTDVNETDVTKMFCSMSPEQWYSFSLLMARHVNMENLVYRVSLN